MFFFSTCRYESVATDVPDIAMGDRDFDIYAADSEDEFYDARQSEDEADPFESSETERGSPDESELSAYPPSPQGKKRKTKKNTKTPKPQNPTKSIN